ncbi:MAG: cysteine desulfurase [Lachnospiraceae bacterium]|nr:cysteine desulfurase [Lachnospiraceae bacterium]
MSQKLIYLDNSATTPVIPEVADEMDRVLRNCFGNPSSMHHLGMDSSKVIKEARQTVAKTLKCRESEIIFTSCGTEADNLAIIGAATRASRAGKHVITSDIEHPAVLESMKALETCGFEVTYLPVNNDAVIDAEELKAAIRPDTVLVSLMYVNNEVGSVMPVAEAGRAIKSANPNTLFHVDAVQAYTKMPLRPQSMGIDLLSASGHKIHASKGVGFLYASDKVKFNTLMLGGGQQSGRRSGTENVPGIAGMALAADKAFSSMEEDVARMYALKSYFIGELLKLDGVYINGRYGRDSAPHIISASFEGIRSQVLLNALDAKGICVSSGSACSANHPGISRTLKSMGVKSALLDSTIRFSMSALTTKEELDYTLEVLNDTLPVLRRFTRK